MNFDYGYIGSEHTEENLWKIEQVVGSSLSDGMMKTILVEEHQNQSHSNAENNETKRNGKQYYHYIQHFYC